MAKHKQAASVEAQLEAETGHDVVKTGDSPPTFVETDKPIAPPVDASEDCYIINDDTGELRLVRTRAGYAPAPMPFGFRLAKNEEIPGK